MSTKLNASELAREQFQMPDDASPYKHAEVSILREGYIAAINTKAQPIADERDEYREALENCLWVLDGTVAAGRNTIADDEVLRNGRAILAQYPKP